MTGPLEPVPRASVRRRNGLLVLGALAIAVGIWLGTRPGSAGGHPTEVVPPNPATVDTARARALDAPAVAPAEKRAHAAPPVSATAPAAAPTEGAIHVRVVDRDWFEPLPAYRLTGRTWAEEGGTSPKPPAELVTDARGRARLPDDWALARATFEMIDGTELATRNAEYLEFARAEFDAAAREGRDLEIPVRTGPTYFFAWTLPEGVTPDSVDVRLASDRPSATSAWPPPGNAALARRPDPATAHPELPWVRFGSPAEFSGRGWLELRTVDGRWRAGAWAPKVYGILRDPIAVTFEPATRVTAHFVWSGTVDEPWVSVLLVERSTEPGRILRSYGGTAGEAGRLAITFVEPGPYRLEVRDAHWAPFARDVDVHAGENDLGELRLEHRPVAGAIRGTITSTSGAYEGACHVSLSRTPFEHDAFYDHSLDFEADESGKLVAKIEFEEVTAGDWYLYVHCHDGFEHPTSLFVVRAPNDDVRIVLEDRSIELELDLIDAATKQPLSDESRVTWGVGSSFDVADGPRVRLSGLPDRPGAIELVASAPGYRPKHGDARGFERVAGSPTRLRATWALEKGFGARVRVLERGSWRPIADATVEADGAPVGTTDARGEIWIERATAPGRIGAEKAGWEREPSRDVDAEGHFRDDDDLVIEMVRP